MSIPTPPLINDWNVSQALSSMARLTELLPELTEADVIAALELESRSRRRRSVINRLISRATRLNELRYSTSLQRKYHGT
jgi:hypothetical protein